MLVVLALGAVGLSVGLAFAVFPPRVTWDTDNRRAEMAACISEYRTDNPGAGVPEATLYCADDTRVTLAFYAPKHVQHVTLKRGLVVGVGLLVRWRDRGNASEVPPRKGPSPGCYRRNSDLLRPSCH